MRLNSIRCNRNRVGDSVGSNAVMGTSWIEPCALVLVLQEARVQRALQRAAAPVFRKSGKPLMLRSTLTRRTAEAKEVVVVADEGDLEAFLALDL